MVLLGLDLGVAQYYFLVFLVLVQVFDHALPPVLPLVLLLVQPLVLLLAQLLVLLLVPPLVLDLVPVQPLALVLVLVPYLLLVFVLLLDLGFQLVLVLYLPLLGNFPVVHFLHYLLQVLLRFLLPHMNFSNYGLLLHFAHYYLIVHFGRFDHYFVDFHLDFEHQ